ncbi:MAG: hypothetical protein HKN26_07480 [Acidimicrobiales bacterium]|nr:hypothetical protein [Acidimicrobiales bacterium]
MVPKILLVASVLASLLVAAPTTAAAEPAVTVSPTGPYTEGDVVTVTGTGLTPSAVGGASVCDRRILDATAVIDALGFCRPVSLGTDRAAADGTYSQDITLQRVLDLPDVSLDCKIEGQCVIGVGTSVDLQTPADIAYQPIVIDGPAPPVSLRVNINRVNGGRVRGAIRCSTPTTVTLVAMVRQTHFQGITGLGGNTMIDCDRVAWFSILLYDRNGGLEAGDVDVTIESTATVDGSTIRARTTESFTLTEAQARKMPRRFNIPGEAVSIGTPRLRTHPDGLLVDVPIACPPGENIIVSGRAEQNAPLKEIAAHGRTVEVCPATGELRPELVIVPTTGALVRGRAALYLFAFGPPGTSPQRADYFKSTAWVPVEVLPEPLRIPDDLDATVEVMEATPGSITFTYECTGPDVIGFLQVEVAQLDGRFAVVELGPSDAALFFVPPCNQPPVEVTFLLGGEGLVPGPAVVRVRSIDLAFQTTTLAATEANLTN